MRADEDAADGSRQPPEPGLHELTHLSGIILVPAEHVGQRVEYDQSRLFVARFLGNLVKKRRGLAAAVAGEYHEQIVHAEFEPTSGTHRGRGSRSRRFRD